MCVVLKWFTVMGNLCHWSAINEAEHNKGSTSTSAAQTRRSCWEIAAKFDEILTRNHQESLPRNSTNGADIFLKKHFGIRNGGMTTARIGHSRAAAHLNAFLLTLLISHLVRLFCALWAIWSLWEDAMAHKGRCTDSQQTSVFVCFRFCAAYLMKIWWFMQLRK